MRSYNEKLMNYCSKLSRCKESQEKLLRKISNENDLVANLTEARNILISVNIIAHDQIKEAIENLVTTGLKTIFGNKYKFVVKSDVKRNKAEVSFYVEQGGMLRCLDDELGCGVLDVVSFILRVVIWSMLKPRSCNTIILDEPGKFISKDKQILFGQLIKELSYKLNIQFIIISHEEELINIADISYSVELKNNISQVLVLGV